MANRYSTVCEKCLLIRRRARQRLFLFQGRHQSARRDQEKGMTVFELNAEEVAKLRERSKPVLEKYTSDLSSIVAEMFAAVDKVRKAR
jgi:hypothetical protein